MSLSIAINGSFFALGTCAWALANAIFAELPIILGWTGDWTLASKIALCIALANFAPLTWSFLADVRGGVPIVSTSIAMAVILAIGLATSICFMLLDTSTAVPLLTLSTLTGIVGSMTLVLFFPHAHPFAIRDDGWSIASLQFGSAVSSLLLAVLAIVQKPASATPRFSLESYFGVVAAMFGIAFVGLAGTIFLHPNRMGSKTTTQSETGGEKTYGSEVFDSSADSPTDGEKELEEGKVVSTPSPATFRFNFWTAFSTIFFDRRFLEANIVQFILNGMTFFLPGVVPYSISNYPDSGLALHYQTVSQLVAQTIGILLTGFPMFRSEKITYQLIAAISTWIPLVVLCVHNNLDSFHTDQRTSAIPITLYTLFMFLYGYTSTRCFQLVSARCTKDNDRGEHVSRVLGLLNQMGAMTGSIIGYLVVQYGVIN